MAAKKGSKGKSAKENSHNSKESSGDTQAKHLGPSDGRQHKPQDKKQHKKKGNQWKNNSDDDDATAQQLKHQLAQLGLHLHGIIGDGNCLFRALSDQMEGNQHRHLHYRTAVCQHEAEQRELYEPFVDTSEESFDTRLARMRRDGVYGENLEVVAFARAFDVDVCIHQVGSPLWIVRANEEEQLGSKERRMLHIVYHSWEHYSSMRNIDSDYDPNQPPQITLRPTHVDAPSARPADAPPNNMENMILRTASLELSDLPRVRSMLRDARGDPGRVLELLFEEQANNWNEEPTFPDGKNVISEDASDVVVPAPESDSTATIDNNCDKIPVNTQAEPHNILTTLTTATEEGISELPQSDTLQTNIPPTPQNSKAATKPTKPKRVTARDKKEAKKRAKRLERQSNAAEASKTQPMASPQIPLVPGDVNSLVKELKATLI